MSDIYLFDDLPDIINNFDIENKRMDSFPLMSNNEILNKIKKKYGPDYKKIIDKRGDFYILLRARRYIYLNWCINNK